MSSIAALLTLLAGALALPHQKRQASGPVIASNWQDPAILLVDDTWYCKSTLTAMIQVKGPWLSITSFPHTV